MECCSTTALLREPNAAPANCPPHAFPIELLPIYSPQCPGLFDIWCVIWNGCWENLFTTLFTIGMVILAIVAAIFMIRKGWCLACKAAKGPKRKSKRGKRARQVCMKVRNDDVAVDGYRPLPPYTAVIVQKSCLSPLLPRPQAASYTCSPTTSLRGPDAFCRTAVMQSLRRKPHCHHLTENACP